jgi:plasmid stability protein
MPKMIQIRNVPDSLHRKLKARAAIEGMTLSDFLLAEMRHSAERPSLRELQERLNQRSPISTAITPADVVRKERERH